MSRNIINLANSEDLESVISKSSEQPIFIYKHSSVCPVSAEAASHFYTYSEMEMDTQAASFAQVLVIENRNISNEIESRFKVKHESPQILLVKDEKVVWHASHFSINQETMHLALEN